MSTPKRHHFVPEAYLAGFTEENSQFLNVYSKISNSWRRQRPKQVMVRNNYYRQSWAPEGIDENVLEKDIGKRLEPQGLRALRKLTTAPESITNEESASILDYLEFQRLRVPRQAKIGSELARNAITMLLMKNPETREALRFNRIEMNDSFRFDFMRMMTGGLTPYMARMVWEVVSAGDDASFITSDSPVSFFNIDFPPPTEAGIGLYGTRVIFPLDSKHLLVMHHPEYHRREKKASDRLPEDLEVEDGVIEIHRGRVWNRETINHHNGVMFHLSQDLIVGCSKDVIEQAVEKVTHGN